ncbi:preprotein translocase subunit YajC [Ancrocorticia populi]|uniref:preprotein translocase subunit YajC n=1 Tax=Ancrocorticia populi TaxID=2175228 RepID=UPI003F91C97E
MDPSISMIILLALMVLMFWWMSRSSKKMREKMAAEREAAVELGNNVVTTAGFFGTIVDIDGDAVTLQSPSGDESVWLRSSINAVSDLPLGDDEDEETAEDATEESGTGDLGENKSGSAWE